MKPEIKRTFWLIAILFLFVSLDMHLTFYALHRPDLIEQNVMILVLVGWFGTWAVYLYMLLMFWLVLTFFYIAVKTKLLIEYRVFIIMYIYVTICAIINNSYVILSV